MYDMVTIQIEREVRDKLKKVKNIYNCSYTKAIEILINAILDSGVKEIVVRTSIDILRDSQKTNNEQIENSREQNKSNIEHIENSEQQGENNRGQIETNNKQIGSNNKQIESNSKQIENSRELNNSEENHSEESSKHIVANGDANESPIEGKDYYDDSPEDSK